MTGVLCSFNAEALGARRLLSRLLPPNCQSIIAYLSAIFGKAARLSGAGQGLSDIGPPKWRDCEDGVVMPTLFESLALGALTTSNRVIMAPLTRSRATREGVPTPMMVEYYGQRATAGLITSESIAVSQQGGGFTYAPGLWSDEQVEAWEPITKAVHDRGGLIIAQLGHTGRAGHSDVIGEQPVSSSATTSPVDAWTYDGPKPSEQARALELNEIDGLISDFARAARNAMAAGFDGVQVHAANGMLIDQFLRDSSNLRTDSYGGSVENRLRLLVQITQAVIDAVGADRTSVRLSPNGEVWESMTAIRPRCSPRPPNCSTPWASRILS